MLMCNNAMTYNQPDTIYYKAAKRLLHAGLRSFSAEKVRPLVPTISNYGELTAAHLGFEPLEESFKAFAVQQQEQVPEVPEVVDHEMDAGFSSGGETAPETARDIFLKKESPTKAQMDGLPDDMTPEEILEQVGLSTKDGLRSCLLRFCFSGPRSCTISREKAEIPASQCENGLCPPKEGWNYILSHFSAVRSWCSTRCN